MDSRINSILSQHPDIFAGIKREPNDVDTMKNIILAKLNYYEALLTNDPLITELKKDITENVIDWVNKVQSQTDHIIYQYNFDVMPATDADIYIKAYRMMDNMLSIYTMKQLRQGAAQPQPEYKPVYKKNTDAKICHYKDKDQCVLSMYFQPVKRYDNSVIIYVPGIGSDISEFKSFYEKKQVLFHFFDYRSKGVLSNVASVLRNAKAVKQTTKPINNPKDRVNRLADLIRVYTNLNWANYVDIHCDSHGTLVTYRAILLLKQMGDAPNLHKIRIFAKSPPRQLPKALVPMGCINFYHERDVFYRLFKLSSRLKIKLFDIGKIEPGTEPEIVFEKGHYATVVIRNNKYEDNVDYYDLAYIGYYQRLLGLDMLSISNIATYKKKYTGYYHTSNNMLYSAISDSYFEFLYELLYDVFTHEDDDKDNIIARDNIKVHYIYERRQTAGGKLILKNKLRHT